MAKVGEGVLEERDPPRGGEPPQAHREEQDQHDAEPEVRDREPAERHAARQVVPDGVPADGGEDTRGDGDQDRDGEGVGRELEGDRELLGHRPRHRDARADGLAEIAGDGQGDPADVLDGDRVAEPVLRPHLLQAGLVGLRSGENAGRVPGDQANAGEDDEADDQEGDQGDHAPVNEELEHGRT